MSQLLRKHIEAITPLTDEEFDYVLSHFSEKHLRKHQYLVQAGDPAHDDHLVLKGCLKAFYTDKGGKDHILQFATENWWVSDYGAFFNQKEAYINIDCMEACEVLCISLHKREKLCSDLHKIEHFFRIKASGGYVALQRRILSLLAGTPLERYEQFVNLYPDLLNRIPKKYIAAYLGVSRETLSRLYSH